MENKIQITFQAPASLYNWIREQSARENRSISNFVKNILLKEREGKEDE
jgi:hypothetical protein